MAFLHLPRLTRRGATWASLRVLTIEVNATIAPTLDGANHRVCHLTIREGYTLSG
jgi:hypothetical protein